MTNEREPLLTETAVRQLARSKSYERGKSYYEDGHIREVVRRGETLQAAVEGSQYEPYRVTIEFDEAGIATTDCSCPYDYGGICKHRVAVLLTYIDNPEEIEHRPSVSELVADVSQETLQELLVEFAETHPHLVEWIETRLETAETQEAADTPQQTQSDINIDSIRRQVNTALPSPHRKPRSDPYTLFERAADDVEAIIEQAWKAIEANDAETALDILEVIAEEISAGDWIQLMPPDSYAMDDVLDELDSALTEAVLTANLSEASRERWEQRITEWNDELRRYAGLPYFDTAVTAATHGWEDDTLQQAMQGEIGPEETQDCEGGYTDASIDPRLNVLEKQNRIEEYLNLAAAAGKTEAYATMLVKEVCFEESIEYGIEQFSSPGEFLTLATTLRDHEQTQAALTVAAHGLAVEGSSKDELAKWLRDRASSMDDSELALEAAIEAFKADPSLGTWQAVEELAGENWDGIRSDLLDYLETHVPDNQAMNEQIEIFLYEIQYDEAIAIADQSNRTGVIEPVVDAVLEERPEWVMEVCKEQAEPIIEQGKYEQYHSAVQWLEKAGKAAQVAGERDEWRAYVEDSIDRHSRKYKLVPMLEELLDDCPQ